MIRAIIIDDEQHCIVRLSDMLARYCPQQIELLATCDNAADALTAIKSLKPDLLFLDVELQETTGMDLLRQFQQIDFEVIFTTAHEKYAIQAFRFSAVDYLLKPIDSDELTTAISKLDKMLGQKDLNNKFEALLQNFHNKPSSQTKKITVPSGNELLFLEISQITRCEADVNYTTIYLKDKQKIMVAKTLKDFDDLLTDHGFFRIHNSHLINLSYIRSYQKGKGGYVVLTDGTNLEVSTRRKELFLKAVAGL
ncbi:MAG: response regulator transcription factor [Mucilaginibacter sp.]|nr:response regulator transcription factor [Mucilaginibacter sp.]